ncbi:MAG: oligosaccharide repeat unit polymerase [Acidobacteria bacterium]|nr:oligosaccharide repeat unit polymerase [Acidobacteriota bacterium]
MLVELNFAASIFFSGMAALAMKISKDLFGSFFAPPGLFGAVWFGSLAVYYTGIVPYYALSFPSVFVFIATTVIFICGCIVGKPLYGLRTVQRIDPIAPSIIGGLRHADKLIYVIFAVGVIGSISYYVLMHQSIGIDSLWRDPISVRYEEAYGRLRHAGWGGVARAFLIPCCVLCAIYLKIKGRGASKRVWAILVMCYLLLLPSSGRTNIGTAIVASFLGIQYLNMGKSRRSSFKAVALPATVFLAFVGYFLYTTNSLDKSVTGRAGMADLSFYLVSGLPAFQQMVQFPDGYSESGHLTFGVVARALHAINPENITKPDYIRPKTTIPFFTNIYTYLDSLFLEYGWIGVFVYPFLLGLALSYLYLSLHDNPGVIKTFVNAMLGTAIVQSLSGNRFGASGVWMWMAVLFATQCVITVCCNYWERMGKGLAGARGPGAQGRGADGAASDPFRVDMQG